MLSLCKGYILNYTSVGRGGVVSHERIITYLLDCLEEASLPATDNFCRSCESSDLAFFVVQLSPGSREGNFLNRRSIYECYFFCLIFYIFLQ